MRDVLSNPRKILVITVAGILLVCLVAVIALLGDDRPFFGAKELCDERKEVEGFGHREWVECFQSRAFMSSPERVWRAASPGIWTVATVGTATAAVAALRSQRGRKEMRPE